MATFQPPQIMPAANATFLYYTDINFQYGVGGNTAEKVSNIDVVNQEIMYLITTVRGSREFEPTFGSKIPKLLFEPCLSSTARLLKMAVIEAVGEWIPRITLSIQKTNFYPMPEDMAFLGIISYNIPIMSTSASLTLKLPSLFM